MVIIAFRSLFYSMDILAYVNDALSTEGEKHTMNYDMTINEWRGVIESANRHSAEKR